MLVNPNKGCGKSNISINLAGYYANSGFKVVLVDMHNKTPILDWLKKRPEECKPILPMTMRQVSETSEDEIDYVIIDTPANIAYKQVLNLLKQSDILLVPVLPSKKDIRDTGYFMYQLLIKHKIIFEDKAVGVIASRSSVDNANYAALDKFLHDVNYTFIAAIRESDNYPLCAEKGMSVFEYDSEAMKNDCGDWQPIIDWLDNKAEYKIESREKH